MSADDKNYKDALLICKIKLSEDGLGGILDLPFPIYSQNVVCEGVNYGPYPLPKTLVGKECLANIHYMKDHPILKKDDSAEVEKFAGVVKKFQEDARVVKHWAITKEDAYKVVNAVTGEEMKYTGTDKDEIAPFCVSKEMK